MKKQSDARQMFAHMLIMLIDPKRRDPRSREVCCTSITSRKVWHWQRQRGAFLDSGLSSQAAQVAHVARCCTMHGARQNRLCRALGLPLEPRQVFSSPPGLLPLLQCGSGRLMVPKSHLRWRCFTWRPETENITENVWKLSERYPALKYMNNL